MTKKFERKCSYCDSIFNHWRSHWNHEKKCGVRKAQQEHYRKSIAWQKKPAQTPEELERAGNPFDRLKGGRE